MNFLILQRSAWSLLRSCDRVYPFLYIIATVFFLPGALKTLDAGAIFGIDLLI
ncbi:MAG: hypothetical protein HC847_23945 [Hydrococcus sp. RU_2_2]|nr:hypothetical protein [Hydrococcus sp. RU_2_2]NJP19260.1 hypothetical protein [Hydrococcus sp. CRU_1_1]